MMLLTLFLILLFILMLLLGGLGLWLAGFVAGGKRQTLKEAYDWQASHYDLSWFTRLHATDYTIRSFDGYELHAQLYRNPNTTGDRYVIITHGYTDNRFGAVKYMKMYLDLGFHCIIYDLRGHGLNVPAPCTYSILESRDLISVIEDTYKRFGAGITLGLQGESLGSASTAHAMKYHPKVAFAVLDCGFADARAVFEHGLSSILHLPKWLVHVAEFGYRLRYHHTFDEMRPVDALTDNTVPMLFLHGTHDELIHPDHSRRMYEATKGYREFHLIPGAEHAGSVIAQPELYHNYVASFLEALK